MGEIGARLADRAFVTSDNPRSEEPLAIIDEIVAGVPAARAGVVTVDPDRRAAIRLALREARADDGLWVAALEASATGRGDLRECQRQHALTTPRAAAGRTARGAV